MAKASGAEKRNWNTNDKAVAASTADAFFNSIRTCCFGCLCVSNTRMKISNRFRAWKKRYMISLFVATVALNNCQTKRKHRELRAKFNGKKTRRKQFYIIKIDLRLLLRPNVFQFHRWFCFSPSQIFKNVQIF